MTFAKLLKDLQKLTPAQLKKTARCFEGCSGNWDSVTSVEIADADIYVEGRNPALKEIRNFQSLSR